MLLRSPCIQIPLNTVEREQKYSMERREPNPSSYSTYCLGNTTLVITAVKIDKDVYEQPAAG
jgi:hypothetical protein